MKATAHSWVKLPNRPQFFIAYNLIDHLNDVNNVQNLSETMRGSQEVSL